MQRANSLVLLLHLLRSNLLVRCSLPLNLYAGSTAILPFVILYACIKVSCSGAQQYAHLLLAPGKEHYRITFRPADTNTYLQLRSVELIQIYLSRTTD